MNGSGEERVNELNTLTTKSAVVAEHHLRPLCESVDHDSRKSESCPARSIDEERPNQLICGRMRLNFSFSTDAPGSVTRRFFPQSWQKKARPHRGLRETLN